MYPYLITVNKQDRVQVRRFEIVAGYTKAIQIDEQKPGLNYFDLYWTKQGTVVTF